MNTSFCKSFIIIYYNSTNLDCVKNFYLHEDIWTLSILQLNRDK